MTRFLNGGDKVKVTIMLRGREISRPIGGVELLQRLADDVEEFGTVESKPKQEGRNIIMTLAPKGKKVHTQSEQRRRGAESRAERQARQAARLAAKQESQAQAAADAKTAISQKTSDKKQTSKEGSTPLTTTSATARLARAISVSCGFSASTLLSALRASPTTASSRACVLPASSWTVALSPSSPSPTRTPSRPSWTPPRLLCLRTSTLRLRPESIDIW